MISIEIISDSYGNIVIIDNRVFNLVKETQVQSIKDSAKEEILNRYPEFKQRNLAMGILTAEEEREIRHGIESIRIYAHSLEDAVNAVSWDGNEETRAAACDAVQSISWDYSSAVVPAPKRYTSYEFLLRFTPEERAAFRAAAATDPNVADFQQLATAAQQVISNDPITIAGMNYLVFVGLLTEERKNEILS